MIIDHVLRLKAPQKELGVFCQTITSKISNELIMLDLTSPTKS